MVAMLLALCAAQPPAIPPAPQTERNYTIKAEGLTIRPGPETTWLHFTDGVTISGKQVEVKAAELEVDIETGEMASLETLKLPKVESPHEQISEDPGKVAAEMARQLKLPSPDFSQSALRRLGATGGITLTGQGMTLSASQVVSADGGRSWNASGACRIQREVTASGKRAAESYSVEAEHLLYDTETDRAAAQGNVVAVYKRGKDDSLSVSAQRGELDLGKQQLSVAGSLTATYGDISISCEGLAADLKAGKITTVGAATISDSGLGVSVSASTAAVDLRSRIFTASGSVSAEARQDGVTLSAAKAEGTLPDEAVTGDGAPVGTVIVLTGEPVVHYKDSSFSGQRITVKQETGKDGKPRTVIEVEGPQKAKLNLDELPKLKSDRGKPAG